MIGRAGADVCYVADFDKGFDVIGERLWCADGDDVWLRIRSLFPTLLLEYLKIDGLHCSLIAQLPNHTTHLNTAASWKQTDPLIPTLAKTTCHGWCDAVHCRSRLRSGNLCASIQDTNIPKLRVKRTGAAGEIVCVDHYA
jgi:hypothetical protein